VSVTPVIFACGKTAAHPATSLPLTYTIFAGSQPRFVIFQTLLAPEVSVAFVTGFEPRRIRIAGSSSTHYMSGHICVSHHSYIPYYMLYRHTVLPWHQSGS